MKEIEAKVHLKEHHSDHLKNLGRAEVMVILDTYFDHPLLDLRSQDKILRLREENGRPLITYKGAREDHKNLLVRTEEEMEIGSFKNGINILRHLGFIPTARVEKRRCKLIVSQHPALSVTIDDYPFIGRYLEAEGPEADVWSFLNEIGANEGEVVQKSCTEIFRDYYGRYDLGFEHPELHFTFADEKLVRSG